MTKVALVSLLLVLGAATVLAAEPGPIRAPVKKLEISCTFANDETKTLEGYGYAESISAEMTFAKVFVYQYDAASSRKRKLGQYFLSYQASPELSLIFRFENKEKKVALEIFGDDRGGMSSLTVAGKQEDLTCAATR